MVSLREFQKIIKDMYFETDRKRGIERTFIWLVEEIGEVARALNNKEDSNIEEELADVIAWTASLANLLGIDLEEAVTKKYLILKNHTRK